MPTYWDNEGIHKYQFYKYTDLLQMLAHWDNKDVMKSIH
jgi:hypothetical protein